jgi:hypothetical protein
VIVSLACAADWSFALDQGMLRLHQPNVLARTEAHGFAAQCEDRTWQAQQTLRRESTEPIQVRLSLA